MQFHFHANQSHFHKNGFALRLALKQRHEGTRKMANSIRRFSMIMRIWVRKQCFSTGYVNIHKELVNSTSFFEGSELYENQGPDKMF